jgi:ubiquinone/menaquinone biosynthesis C-methylase UbiE
MDAIPGAGAGNSDEIVRWNSVGGETWAALSERLDAIIEPLGARAMAALAPAAGERVIDIGCGCGQTTLALARSVGGGGAVVGVDVSAPMLAVARARAARAGVSGVLFLRADAQTHAFEAGGADAVFSRFGVMFFADPAAAFANIAAVLRPGGRLGFLCWRAMAENPMMTLPFAAVLPLIGPLPPPPDPFAPGPFAFADETRLRGILAAAGFEAIDAAPLDHPVNSGSLDEAVDTALRIGPLGAILRERPQLEGAVVPAIRAALAPFVTSAGVVQDSATWIVTARRKETA